MRKEKNKARSMHLSAVKSESVVRRLLCMPAPLGRKDAISARDFNRDIESKRDCLDFGISAPPVTQNVLTATWDAEHSPRDCMQRRRRRSRRRNTGLKPPRKRAGSAASQHCAGRRGAFPDSAANDPPFSCIADTARDTPPITVRLTVERASARRCP
ncbi:unnamed protein product, partial [Iphiclides podalirius]